MTREDLVISQAVLQPMRQQAEPEKPAQQLWSDASGKFQIMATYLDSKDGFVSLRKPDGSEVSVPTQKLSAPDQMKIQELAGRR